MSTLRVNDVLKDRILVSRESAHLLEDALSAIIANRRTPESTSDPTPVTLDFEGVEGITPSFLDELISVFEGLLGAGPDGRAQPMIVTNPPTRLSPKFEAVTRGHGMSVRALPDGSWLLTDVRDFGQQPSTG
jgi:hypothetical protein